ncbi:MAG: sugar transferase [Anaerolineae bacterium]|nr:sugar transferase [Anaerolineae bacterium]
MAKFRLLLILLTLWLFLMFNLARPDVLIGTPDFPLDLSSLVFVVSTIMATAILLMPDLARVRIEFMFSAALMLYIFLRLTFVPFKGVAATDPRRAVYLVVAEVIVLFISLILVRAVSLAVTSFEKAVENIVLRPSQLRILPQAEGEEAINSELFRARRFDRPVAFILIDMSMIEKLLSSHRTTLESVFQRHYAQTRVAQIVEATLYKTDIVTRHGENFFICLPETTYQDALRTAQELDKLIRLRLDLKLPMGVVAFPENGLIYSDLVEAAIRSASIIATEEETTTAAPVKRSTGLLPKLDVDVTEGTSEPTPVRPASVQPNVSVTANQRSEAGSAPASSGAAVAALPVPVNGNPIRKLLDAYRNLYDILPVPEVGKRRIGSERPSDPDFWVNLLPYQSASARAFYRAFKRAFDLSLVLGTAPLWLPLMVIVALLVYLDSGKPIFFTQERTGRGGKRFKMYKFRTMVPNAEELLKELAARGLAKLDAKGKLAEPLKLERDPRVTRIGRFLRKTSLDELPQLFNVIKGDMSLVGPRPTSWDLGSYTLLQTERLSVRPGITGLWQVYGRGDTDFSSWVQWDVLYIEKMSFTLDVKILIRTVSQVLKRRGAR